MHDDNFVRQGRLDNEIPTLKKKGLEKPQAPEKSGTYLCPT
jgi:hypothetical protein